MTAERQTMRFVRLALAGAEIRQDGESFIAELGQTRSRLPGAEVGLLMSEGVLGRSGETLRARPEARYWLKRQMADHDQHAAQHRTVVDGPDNIGINLDESPLARLAASRKGEPAFLAPHHLLAGERVRGLVERGHLSQRVTMSYDAARVPGGTRGGGGSVGDMVLDARQELGRMLERLPPDCAGVVLDVCGYLKGLQQVEQERKWPRRSAKLVLRIGLDQAAGHFGLSPAATGVASRRSHNWLGEGARPLHYG